MSLLSPFQLQASPTRTPFLPSPLPPSCPGPALSQTQPHFCPQALLLGASSMGSPREGAWGVSPAPPAAPRTFSLSPGIRTGKCVAFNNTVKTCEIFGWCPVEVDDSIPR